MLDHLGLNVADYERSKAFYGQALAPLGLELLMEPVPGIGGFGTGGKPFFWIANREDLYDNPRHPYTRALMSAVPEATADDVPARERILLTGDVPSPLNPPSGCRFRTRCWKATDKCATEAPPLVQISGSSDGHLTACHYPETRETIPAQRLAKDPEAAV